MKTVYMMTCCAAIAACTSAAFAADITMAPPPPPLVPAASSVALPSGWNGFYVGAGAARAFSSRSQETHDRKTTSHRADRTAGNLFAGYNWQSGSFVYGIEGDVGFGHRGAKEGGEPVSLRGRAGYALNDRVLLYGAAGGVSSLMALKGHPELRDEVATGWTVGVGADVKVTDKVFTRLEYRHSEYGADFNVGGKPYNVEAKDNKVLVGLGIKF